MPYSLFLTPYSLPHPHWRRGLRAGFAVGIAMLTCRLLGRPTGWAALGALQVIMVDNGGPYRSRFANFLTTLLGSALAVALGVLAGASLPLALAITALFCFTATLSRVLSQPLAASNVIILVSYIVAYGSPVHTTAAGLTDTAYFVAGGLWSAAISLILWPADPFRPARLAVADLYATLTQLAQLLPTAHPDAAHPDAALSTAHPDAARPTAHPDAAFPAFNQTLARLRLQLEQAQSTLAATPARMTSRTIRARNLAVLTESADLLLARILRLQGLTEPTPNQPTQPGWPIHADGTFVGMSGEHQQPALPLTTITHFLLTALAPIEPALRQRPTTLNAYAHNASLTLDLHRALTRLDQQIHATYPETLAAHITAALHESALTLEVSYEAIRAIWTGADPLRRTQTPAAPQPSQHTFETLRAALTPRSITFRHALRLALVVSADILIIHFVHVTHGYWLAMTSIIVLQPYTGETVRKSGQRVLGTVAGAAIAAILAAVIPGQLGILAVITVGATFAISFYAVDYAWYCFFLTPTIVLMTLPHLRDWHFAAVRMSMTVLGAAVSVLAMLLLWPERESLQLPGLLARAASADAAYLRATLAFWQQPDRLAAERTLLAPARRQCGLATNDAEETLDHALLEHSIPLNPASDTTARLNQAALTFTTYIRRLTQAITTLAAVGDLQTSPQVTSFATRLDAIAAALPQSAPERNQTPRNPTFIPEFASAATSLDLAENKTLATEQLFRIDRQVSILEQMSFEINNIKPA